MPPLMSSLAEDHLHMVSGATLQCIALDPAMFLTWSSYVVILHSHAQQGYQQANSDCNAFDRACHCLDRTATYVTT